MSKLPTLEYRVVLRLGLLKHGYKLPIILILPLEEVKELLQITDLWLQGEDLPFVCFGRMLFVLKLEVMA